MEKKYRIILGLLTIALLTIGFSSVFVRPAKALFQETLTPSITPSPTPSPTPIPRLEITKMLDIAIVEDMNGNGIIDPGDTIKYSISYQYFGSDSLENVRIVDEYDQNYILEINNIEGGGIEDEGKIAWKIGKLSEADGKRTISYEARIIPSILPSGSVTVTNLVSIFSDQIGTVSDQISVIVVVPDLKIKKNWELVEDLNFNSEVDPGDTVKYFIVITNFGDISAIDAIIVDDYNQDLFNAPTEIDVGGEDNRDKISWSINFIEPGEENAITLSYLVTLNLNFNEGKTIVENSASVSSQGTKSKSVTNSFEVDVPDSSDDNSSSGAAGPTSEAISPIQQTQLAQLFLLVILAGLLSFTSLSKDAKPIPPALRDAFILAMVISPVVILALAGSIERSVVASLIGTLAGYLLKQGVDRGRELDDIIKAIKEALGKENTQGDPPPDES